MIIFNQDGHMAYTREDEHQGSPHWVYLSYSLHPFCIVPYCITLYRNISFHTVSYRIQHHFVPFIRYGFHVNNPDEVARGEKPILTEVVTHSDFLQS